MADNTTGMSLRGWVEWFFYFTMAFAGYLFLKGPATNNAQLTFRLSLLAVGCVGAGVMLILRIVENFKER